MGWDNLFSLLSGGRATASAPEIPVTSFIPPVTDLQGIAPSSVPTPSRQAVPDWAIKSGLGLAVIAAFGFMLSAFSWWPGTVTTSGDLTDVYVGGDSGGGPGPVVGNPSNINSQQHIVHGYTRSDGRYVAPYVATNPDQDRTNNLSSRGNTNPYTGARGRR